MKTIRLLLLILVSVLFANKGNAELPGSAKPLNQGGHVVVVNGTDRDWKLVHKHSNQMNSERNRNSWDNFPGTIKAGQTVSVYVEFEEGITVSEKDDGGEARYQLDGTGEAFEIRARADDDGNFRMEVGLTNISAKGKQVKTAFGTRGKNGQGTIIDLGWNHDGNVNFVLTGKKGQYTGTNLDTESWMQDNINMLGNRRLLEICIPGTHDSGMHRSTWNTVGSRDGFTVTQSKNIGQQLNLGARFFDIRPAKKNDKYYTAHLNDEMGSGGQPMEEVIQQVNSFTNKQNELVILNVSHSKNTDKDKWPSFTTEEWITFLNFLKGKLNNLIIAPASADLPRMKLNQLLKSNQKLIVLIDDDNLLLPGELNGKGFFTKNENFAIYDDYSNSKNWGSMRDDQIKKMKKHGLEYFLLSWTLTQQWGGTDAVFNFVGTNNSIMQLAGEANNELTVQVYQQVSPQAFPNVISIDDMHDDQAAALAMAINWKRDLFSGYSEKPYKSHLLAGEALAGGEKLTSRNGAYSLIMQMDGNVVIYDREKKPIWATQTQNKSKGGKFILQDDGNLCLYKDDDSFLWCSMKTKATKLVMENDGRLVQYDSANKPIWSSR